MMHYASQGVRNAARKGSNALVHHSGHNGPGGSTTANTRSIHIPSPLHGSRGALHAPQFIPTGPTLESIRPRNPAHRLFSTSRNFLQKFFTHLTAPGLRAPTYLSEIQHAGSRSLHNSAIRGSNIQNGFSIPVRNSLRNNAIQRQGNMFLPRGPGPVPPRCGGVAQVGLGAARNFSTGRPLFQKLAENVPVAGRAAYEIDWDLKAKKDNERKRILGRNGVKKVTKTKEMIKPVQKNQKRKVSTPVVEVEAVEELEHYFSTVTVAPVTTYLLIPLAPTPTSRVPLSRNPSTSPLVGSREPSLLPPLSYIGAIHASHSTHALRVSTIFHRLDQANVWARGVQCSAYSQGHAHQRPGKVGETDASDEGVCTVLKVEFVGWTKAEVRGVIGESGTGWCALEEVNSEVEEEEVEDEDEGLLDMDSISSGLFEDATSRSGSPFNTGLGFSENGGASAGMIDPAQSFILPTIDFSSSSLSSSSSSSSASDRILATVPSEMESDPWVDDFSDSLSSGSSSDLSDLIIDPASTNGWFGSGYGAGLAFSSQFEGRRSYGTYVVPP
ncbi:hypothetical protein B0H34DRAFT_693122 [Crassisporium funariophilum]|nr:hypothetical protein B0H34DRAFT_693122 [Crassisporium funariophilum]